MPALSATTPVPVDAGSATGSGEVVVAIVGDLDLAGAPAMLDALARAMDDGPAVVVVDLSEVTFLDASGLSVLVMTSTRLRGRGARLALRAAPPRVRWLLELTGLSVTLGLEPPPAGQSVVRVPRQG